MMAVPTRMPLRPVPMRIRAPVMLVMPVIVPCHPLIMPRPVTPGDTMPNRHTDLTQR